MKHLYLLFAMCLVLTGFAQSLEKDALFNPFALSAGQYYVDGVGTHCVVQPDGKLIVAETSFVNPSFSKLTRIAGNLADADFFQTNAFNGLIYDIALQADGKILVVGAFTTVNGQPSKYIVRLNANGTVDNTFAVGSGFSTYVNSNYTFASAVVVRPDGKILVGGDLMQYNGVYKNSLFLLNPDGTVDESFTLDPTIGQPSIGKITLLASGEILISTLFFSNIYKLNADGSRHATHFLEMLTFASNTSPASNTVIRFMVEESNGKILIGGRFTTVEGFTRRDLVRVNLDGTVDTGSNLNGFNGPGILDDSRIGVSSIVLQADGKFIVGGDFRKYAGEQVLGIMRLNADFTRDTSFDGALDADASDNIHYYSYFNVLKQHPDGDLVGVGRFKNYNLASSNNFVKINPDGSKDDAFDNICRGFDESMQKFALQPDGKILAIGRFHSFNGYNRNRIVRLNADGSVDEGFEAQSHHFLTDYVSPRDIAIQPDGKILIASDGRWFGSARGGSLVRLNADGTNDDAFNPLTPENYGVRGQVMSIALQPDGKIIIAGSFQFGSTATTRQMARFNADGTHDASFIFTSPFTYVAKIHLNNDGTILVNGIVDNYRSRIIRLSASGEADATFTMAPSLYFTGNRNLYMDVQPDGKILVTSDTSTQSAHKIWRLNPDGTLDPTFNFTPISTYFYGNQCARAFMPDGKILIAVPNTVNTAGLIRLNANGSVDSSFNLGTGIGNGFGYSIAAVDKTAAIAVQPDGKILLGGGFRTFQGVEERGILRLIDPQLSQPGIEQNARVTLYPNPAQSDLYISGIADGTSVVIYNAIGQTIKDEIILEGKIRVAELQSGIYLLKAGNQPALRFVKQ